MRWLQRVESGSYRRQSNGGYVNYYKRHLGDYARDTGDLTMLQHGAFGLLLDRYYSDEKPLKASKVYAIGKARNQAERDAVDFVLKEYFSLTDGLWSNAKADSVIDASKKKSKSCSDAAKSKKINDDSERTLSENEADALQESSERLASHKPLAISHKPVAKEQDQQHAPASPTLTLEPPEPKAQRDKAPELPDWLDKDAWRDWCAFRKRGKAPFTAHAQILSIAKLEALHKIGHKARPVVDQSIERGWSGLFEVKGDQMQRGGGQPQQSHSRAAGRPLE